MKLPSMTSLERVLTTLSHKEPDRVPLFLSLTMHGAKELGCSIKDYFSKSEYVVEGQLRLRNKFQNDCINAIFYAPIEIEAWGGEVIFSDDGPPNSGEPFIRRSSDILQLDVPDVRHTPCLIRVLEAIRQLKEKIGNDAPIIGVAVSPFSLPVMQMGFDQYIRLLYEEPDLFSHLMTVNQEFCVRWANAQLDAGAAAICYFDPVSSTTVIPKDLYLKTGFEIAKKTLSRIKGPTATHMASGKCLTIVEDIAKTGTAAIGVSYWEDLTELKARCSRKISVIGNLNGIEMVRWTPEQAESAVKDCIKRAGKGGGFILSDNHGEIPFQTPDQVLFAISEAVQKWGRYPLDWF